ncbi:hypothetical protein PLICRDRAFT_294955 [Plicaturopsis crispa FD-325 SS-3]|nr:hypothetical protein PLICRDRAFT_294955 [Plicaturopsis crispa FD-325 SS-3]
MMPSPNFGSGTMPSRFGGGHSTTKAQSLPIPEVRYSSGSRLPDVKPKISDLDAVLREDLTGSVHNIPNALFFPHILGVELDELIKWEEYFHSQMDDEELVKWMKKLCEGSSSDETFLYATFSYAANRITELSYAPGAPVVKTKNPGRCFGPNEFVWLRNDPVILKGSDADRKPDCIGTSKARRELRIRELKEAARALVSHIRSPKTTKWNDPTISVEFKRRLYRLIWALYQATARAPFSRKSPAPSQSLTVVDDAVVFPMPDTQVNKQDLENLDEISVEPTNTRPGQSPSKIAAPAPLVSKPLDELVVMSEQPNANKKRALKGTNVGSSSKKQKIDSKKGEAEEPDRTEPTCSLIEQSGAYHVLLLL